MQTVRISYFTINKNGEKQIKTKILKGKQIRQIETEREFVGYVIENETKNEYFTIPKHSINWVLKSETK